jgi:hypothetical protein
MVTSPTSSSKSSQISLCPLKARTAPQPAGLYFQISVLSPNIFTVTFHIFRLQGHFIYSRSLLKQKYSVAKSIILAISQ